MAERTDADLRTIAETAARSNAAAGTPARQIGDFYRSAMDEARLAALGAQPVRPQLERFAAIRNREEFAFEAGRLTSLMAGGPFGNSIIVDATDSQRLLVEIPQGGTMLPNRDYYLNTDAASVELRQRTKATWCGSSVSPAAPTPRRRAIRSSNSRSRSRRCSCRLGEPHRGPVGPATHVARARHRDAGVRLDCLGEATGLRSGVEHRAPAAVVLSAVRCARREHTARHAEELAGRAAPELLGALSRPGVRGSALRGLRPDPDGPGVAARTLAHRRLSGEHVSHRCDGPALRGTAFHTGRQGPCRTVDDEPPDRVPAGAPGGRLAVAVHEARGARQAVAAPAEDRRARAAGATIAISRSKKTISSATSCAGAPSTTGTGWPASPGRSTRTSGWCRCRR